MQCNTYWRHMKRHLSPCKRLSPLTICRCSKYSIMMSPWYLFQASMARHNLTLESAQDGSFMCSTLTSFLRPGCTPFLAWLSWVQVGFVDHKAGCLLSRDMLTRYNGFPIRWRCPPGGEAGVLPVPRTALRVPAPLLQVLLPPALQSLSSDLHWSKPSRAAPCYCSYTPTICLLMSCSLLILYGIFYNCPPQQATSSNLSKLYL